MERIILEISVIVIVYFAGYRIGYRDCFNFLKQKLEEYKDAKKM